MQVPQSPGQLTQVSPMPGSHMPLPHDEHWSQSVAQLVQFSPLFGSQVPLPQSAHGPQSTAHVVQLSPIAAKHVPSPQPAQLPQSTAQLLQSSPLPGSHVPLPQLAHSPQSGVHDEQSSPIVASHVPSPQSGHRPQSCAQFAHVSPLAASQALSPHPVHRPQSVSQLKQSSPPSQTAFPQTGAASGEAAPPSLPQLSKSRHATTSNRVMAMGPSASSFAGAVRTGSENEGLASLQVPTTRLGSVPLISDPVGGPSAKSMMAAEAKSVSDREHLAAFRDGKRDALERVYREHVAGVISFLRSGFMYTTNDKPTRFSGVRDSFELESLVQEVFTRAFQERARLAYDGLRPYAGFLNGIARNLVLDRLRKDARHGEVLTAPEAFDATPHSEPERETEDERRGRDLVLRFLETECDERDRAFYAARFERELSQVDAAREMGRTRIQVRRWETKFRERLIRFLKRADYVRDG